MGRWADIQAEGVGWRDAFRSDLASRFDEAFAAEAMTVLDEEISSFGEDRSLLEALVPARVLARRRGAGRG